MYLLPEEIKRRSRDGMASQRQRIMNVYPIHTTAGRLLDVPKILTNETKQVGIVEHCRDWIISDYVCRALR